MEIPYGYCHCGCGNKAPVAKQTSKRYGHIKGSPVKFINGHNSKGEGNGRWKGGLKVHRCQTGEYVLLHGHKDHPRNINGYAFEHILKAEKVLGRSLKLPEVVHHIDGDGKNNENNNLVICNDHAYHVLLHKRQRALKTCGHAGWQVCYVCHQYGDPSNMEMSSAGKSEYGTQRFRYKHKNCNQPGGKTK